MIDEEKSCIITKEDIKLLDCFGIERDPSQVYMVLEDISRRTVKYGVWYLSGLSEDMKIGIENLMVDIDNLRGYIANICKKKPLVKKRVLDFYDTYKEEINKKQGKYRLNSCLGLVYKNLNFIDHLDGYADFISILEDNLDGFRELWSKRDV